MELNNKELMKKADAWMNMVVQSKLPVWDELPTLELYMDQVIVMVNNYLSYIVDLTGDDKNVTPSMINNYVKMKIIPPPVKKKYSRIHLAGLLMVCSLKRCLNISTINKILPKTSNVNEVKEIYNSFVKHRQISIEKATKQVEELVYPVITNGELEDVYNLVTRAAVTADLHKLFTEKISEEIFGKEELEDGETPKSKKKEKPILA